MRAELEADQKKIQELRAALQAVDTAIEQAESNLEKIPSLPSAELPKEDDLFTSTLKRVAAICVACLVLVIPHFFGWPVRIIVGVFAGIGVGYFGYIRESLDKSGAIAASLVGACTLVSSFRAAVVLLTFFFTSSKLTTYCEERKLDDEEAKKGGQRDWIQVASNGLIPSLLILAAASISKGVDWPMLNALQDVAYRRYSALTAAFLGYYACCCGDTWASEVGQLSEDTPRLITSFRPVRKGTNGGVTKLGLLASVSGGLCMGVVFYLSSFVSAWLSRGSVLQKPGRMHVLTIFLGALAGLLGSLIDSVLGATIQFTGFNRVTQKVTSKNSEDVSPISGLPILSNNGVNLVSASLTALFTAVIFLTFGPAEVLV